MGRPKKPAEIDAAQGFPSKRKTKTEKAILEADRLAQLLALPRAEETSGSPPVYLSDPRLAPALTVWNEYAPRLDKLHLLARLDRHTFALFCVYAAEFVQASEDILVKGYSSLVKTVSGGKMPRENPSVARRDFAAKMVLELSTKFGLTPADRNKLLRDGAMHFDDETLFGRQLPQKPTDTPSQPEEPREPAKPSGDGGAIGSLSNFDSVPP